MLKRVLRSHWAQASAAGLIRAYLRLALGTTRWSVEGEAHLAPFVEQTAVLVVFWHECLPLMPAVWWRVRQRNRTRSGAVLASRHRDGALLGAVMAGFGLAGVQGSSERHNKRGGERGGGAALVGLARQLRQGAAVMITPDGPRGPARVAAEGVAHLAALSGAPVLPMAARVRRRIVLNSWDRMILPLPFGRGTLVCLPPFFAGRDDDGATARIAAAMTQAAEQAELLCS